MQCLFYLLKPHEATSSCWSPLSSFSFQVHLLLRGGKVFISRAEYSPRCVSLEIITCSSLQTPDMLSKAATYGGVAVRVKCPNHYWERFRSCLSLSSHQKPVSYPYLLTCILLLVSIWRCFYSVYFLPSYFHISQIKINKVNLILRRLCLLQSGLLQLHEPPTYTNIGLNRS